MKGNRILDFILGLGFVILGILAINRPASTLGILVFFFGAMAIIRGIESIFGLGSVSSKESRGARVFLGMIDLIIGILFLSNQIHGALFLGIMFAIWFMSLSIGNLFLTARFSKAKGFGKILIFLFDVIAFAFAVMLLFNPIVAALTLPKLVGFFSVAFGFVLMIQGSNVGGSAGE